MEEEKPKTESTPPVSAAQADGEVSQPAAESAPAETKPAKKSRESTHYPSSHVGHIAYLILAFLLGGLLGYYVGMAYQNEASVDSTNTNGASSSSLKPTVSASVSADATSPTVPASLPEVVE